MKLVIGFHLDMDIIYGFGSVSVLVCFLWLQICLLLKFFCWFWMTWMNLFLLLIRFVVIDTWFPFSCDCNFRFWFLFFCACMKLWIRLKVFWFVSICSSFLDLLGYSFFLCCSFGFIWAPFLTWQTPDLSSWVWEVILTYIILLLDNFVFIIIFLFDNIIIIE